MRRLMAVLSVLLLGGVLVAPVAAQNATPMAGMMSASQLGLQEIKITVTDAGFEGAPTQLAAGRYLVTVTNSTKVDTAADFLQLPAGMTADTLGAVLAAQGTPAAEGGAAASPEGGPLGPPAFLFQTKIAGGAGAAAGQSAQAIVDLTPGNWVIWGGDPADKVKPVALTVTGGASASPTALQEPKAAVTVNEVNTAQGFAFQVDGAFASGQQIIKVVNQSNQPHFLLLLKSPVQLTMDQVTQLLQLPENATPAPGSGLPSPQDFKTAGLMAVMSAGTTAWLVADLQPGFYVLLCFVPDPTKGGIPHAAEGMAHLVTISGGAGTPVATPPS